MVRRIYILIINIFIQLFLTASVRLLFSRKIETNFFDYGLYFDWDFKIQKYVPSLINIKA